MRFIMPILLVGCIGIHALISCSFGENEPTHSSSSATKTTKSSSSLDCSTVSSSSINEDLCSDFDPDAEIEHYGKMKKQFCDERDGKRYVYVEIGEQTWMAENLNYAVCGDICASPNKDKETCDQFGRLYDWRTALTICPDGWHLPSDAEWTALTDYAGGE